MSRIRTLKNALTRLVAASSQPCYALNPQRRIIYCNHACEVWTGWSAEQLSGVQANYHSQGLPGELVEIAGGLCPPPEVFLGQAVTIVAGFRRRSGQLTLRRAHCLPLHLESAGAEEALAAITCPPCGALVVVQRDEWEEPTAAADAEPTPPQLHERLRSLLAGSPAALQIAPLIGESPAMRRAREQVELAIGGQARVLVTGPAGSGCEEIARVIHYHRSSGMVGPLVPLNCALLDAELLQSTITAFVRRGSGDGEEEAALLLADAQQMPPGVQSELAGFFSLPDFSLRTLATSNQPLLDLAARGEFLPALAFALSTLVIEIPPLSQRSEDIRLLAQHFLERHNAQGGPQFGGFTPEALDLLLAHPWQRNADELAELVAASCRVGSGPRIRLGDLPPILQQTAHARTRPKPVEERIVLDDFLLQVERELITRALRQSKGNKSRAAQLLGISRARLLRRLQQVEGPSPAGPAAAEAGCS